VKVISGGQTGVDQAGLRAARRMGFHTGGWAPRGWLTLDGSAPWLAEYGLAEHGGYAARTRANVRDSDGTVRIASDFKSAGELCTKRAILEYRRPYSDFLLGYLDETAVMRLVAFLNHFEIRILNVAGNSEQTSPGIGKLAEDFLVRVFERL
jgi:hypothetical protein